MGDFTHIIITRYNVGLYSGGFFAKPKIPSDEWMRQRYALFTKWAAPSIASQSCTNFKWLLLFDPLTPEAHIADIIRGTPCVALTTQPNKLQVLAVRNWVNDVVRSEWLITTRFDTDDALHADFVADVQTAFRHEHEVLCFNHGWWLKGDQLYTSEWRRNAFISLIEPTATASTVVDGPHRLLCDKHPYRELPRRRWLHVMHDSNMTDCEHISTIDDKDALKLNFPFVVA